MRKRKATKKSDEESGASDGGEEAEMFQDSGEDWTPDGDANAGPPPVAPKGPAKKRPKPGPRSAVAKKKRGDVSSEESDEDKDLEGDEEASEDSDGKSDSSQAKDVPKHFHSGNFVLLKTDVKWDGDKVVTKLSDLNLWKIDGKALLQKYIPMDYNEKILHKCTCVYSGWNADNRENYYPISEIVDKNPKTNTREPCVALDLDGLVKVRDKC